MPMEVRIIHDIIVTENNIITVITGIISRKKGSRTFWMIGGASSLQNFGKIKRSTIQYILSVVEPNDSTPCLRIC